MSERDANGREIHEGDLLRSRHFRGPRNRMFYLYHVVVRRGDHLWMVPTSHLAGEQYVKGGGECLLKSRHRPTAEIIDGYTNGWWYDRPRLTAPTEKGASEQ